MTAINAEPLFTFDENYENPRGIPRAKFIENVAEYVAKNGGNIDNILKRLAEEYSKYKLAEQRLQNSKTTLERKIPEITKTLKALRFLKEKLQVEEEDAAASDEEPLQVEYGLTETVFCRAQVKKQNTVHLWLGANVMAEYTYDEAIGLLQRNEEGATTNIHAVQEDLAWVQEQQTIMEVNTSRTYNYDVISRRDGEGKK
ncbi:hypothetical protein STCU_01569 [Strigomonas culicis]|uniref:Prefoldin subunit 3 n=1 Tax=Strigomonas culicis TaxID=28005 RepID=S9UY24_9TRYP|nr:hypothetical protein STCU_05482 [Strigomonas culicis]EPY33614.1 hypothetical protein STCU_02130 [Strigomonas culicis]EPY34468.1 hypothetical protein STCU_01569 [Strigomonas culicis]|eukprot:EPY27856.1 hypothetical protein STCU_05482 [Strigomonas culicis]